MGGLSIDDLKKKRAGDEPSRLTEGTWIVIGLLVTGIVGWLDLITGYEFSFSVFYLIPVALVSWKVGRFGGIVISVASAITWLLVETILRSATIFSWVAAQIPFLSVTVRTGPAYSSSITPFWNAGVRLAFFLIITLLLTKRRKGFPEE